MVQLIIILYEMGTCLGTCVGYLCWVSVLGICVGYLCWYPVLSTHDVGSRGMGDMTTLQYSRIFY